jgi:Amt family ammonium transporter
MAEETGLILDIGSWVINEACGQMKEWQQTKPVMQELTMSINLSVQQFLQKDLVESIAEALHKNRLDPKCLKIELTESMLMEDSEAAVMKLKQMKEIGVQLVIDDFGTGYSSLSYLNQFPIDNVKIDRSFIRGLGTDRESTEIVKTIVSLGKNLGHDVVAEGVEQDSQLRKLEDLACDRAQGFLFSKPVDKDEALELINKFT